MSRLKKLLLVFFLLTITVLGFYFWNNILPKKRMAQHHQRGLIYLRQNSYADAAQEFENVLKIAPQKEDIRLMLAQAYHANNDLGEAALELEKILSKDRKNREAHLLLANIYMRQDKNKEALSLCNQFLIFLEQNIILEDNFQTNVSANPVENIFVKENQYSEDLAFNDSLLKLSPEDVDILNQRGLIREKIGVSVKAVRDFKRAIYVNNANESGHIHLARLYWTLDRKEEAISVLRKYLESYSSNFAARVQLGKFYLASLDYSQATYHFFYLYRENPKSLVDIAPFLVLSAIGAGKERQAIALAEQTIEQLPSKLHADPVLFYARGLGFLKKKKYHEAIKDFEWAKQASLGISDLYYKLALAYSATKKDLLAVAELRYVVRFSPMMLSARRMLVNLLIKERQFEKAQEQCEFIVALLKDKEQKNMKIRFLRLQARALTEQGKNNQAREVFALIHEISPSSIGGQLGLVIVDMLEKRHRRAILRLQSLLVEEKEKIEGLNKEEQRKYEFNPDPYMYYLLAQNHFALKEIPQAIEYVEKTLELVPNSIQTAMLLAQIRIYQKAPDLAAKEYEKLFKAMPENNRVCQALVNFQLSIPRPKEAMKTLEKAGKSRSIEPAFLQLRARIHLAQEEYEEALKILEEMSNKKARIYELIGDIHRKLGNQEKALKSYQLAQGIAGGSTLYVTIAISNYLLWNWEIANESIKTHLQKFPNDNLVRLFWSIILLSSGENNLAFEETELALKDERKQIKGLARLVRSSTYLANNDYDKAKKEIFAIPEITEAFKKDFENLLAYCKKENTNFNTLLGVIILNALGDADSALFQCKNAPAILQSNLYFMFIKASILRALGQIEEEQKILEKLAQNPEIANLVHTRLGQILMQRRQLLDAIEYFKISLDLDPGSAQLLTNLAICYQSLRDYAKAKEYHQQVLEATKKQLRHPLRAEAFVHLARLSLVTPMNLDFAIHCAQQAYKMMPKQPTIVDTVGVVHAYHGKYGEALKYFEEAHHLEPENPSILYHFAAMSIKKKNWKEATKALQMALQVATRFPELRAAKKILGNLIETQNKPTDVDSWVKHGIAFARLGHNEEAESSLREAIKLDPNSSKAYFHLARIYWDTKRHQEMESTLLRALAIEPESPILLASLAGFYESQKLPSKAIEYYEKVVELTKDKEKDLLQIQSFNNLAYLYLLPDSFSPVLSLEYAKKAYELLPENPAILDTLGWSYFHNKKYEEALGFILKAQSLTVNSSSILYHLAATYSKLGKKEESIERLKEALEISQDFAEVEEAKKLLRSLQ